MPSGTVGRRNTRERKNASKTIGQFMIIGFWGPLEGPLEALLGRFSGVVGRPEAIFGVSRASWS
eukprot:6213568-Pyramimonas_sp.AAC.1